MHWITFVIIIFVGLILFWLYLNRPPKHKAVPAEFTLVELKDGSFSNFYPNPKNIFGIGLSYAKHINEIASDVDPTAPPPIFKKSVQSLISGGNVVSLPSEKDMFNSLEKLEPGIGQILNKKIEKLPALLDHEVELGIVLLENIKLAEIEDPDYIPKLGFFIANDLSARSMAVLGADQENIYEYWGLSKSFSGFTPYSDQIWVPNEFNHNTIPLIRLQTRVNGELRQDEMTDNMIFTPKEMLKHILRTQSISQMEKGDIVLTGTPGGVILNLSRWKLRLGNLLGMNRFQKLRSQIRPAKSSKFLQPGDKVVVEGIGLGKAEITINS